MKIIKIDKTDWAEGLQRAKDSYRLVGPVKGENDDSAEFRELGADEQPDMTATDPVLSPKSSDTWRVQVTLLPSVTPSPTSLTVVFNGTKSMTVIGKLSAGCPWLAMIIV